MIRANRISCKLHPALSVGWLSLDKLQPPPAPSLWYTGHGAWGSMQTLRQCQAGCNCWGTRRRKEVTTCADSPRSFFLLLKTTCADSPRSSAPFLVEQLRNRTSCTPSVTAWLLLRLVSTTAPIVYRVTHLLGKNPLLT